MKAAYRRTRVQHDFGARCLQSRPGWARSVARVTGGGATRGLNPVSSESCRQAGRPRMPKEEVTRLGRARASAPGASRERTPPAQPRRAHAPARRDAVAKRTLNDWRTLTNESATLMSLAMAPASRQPIWAPRIQTVHPAPCARVRQQGRARPLRRARLPASRRLGMTQMLH